MAAVFSLCGFHKRGVAAVDFAANSATLVSVGLDDEHSIAVYDVAKVSFSAYSSSTHHYRPSATLVI